MAIVVEHSTRDQSWNAVSGWRGHGLPWKWDVFYPLLLYSRLSVLRSRGSLQQPRIWLQERLGKFYEQDCGADRVDALPLSP